MRSSVSRQCAFPSGGLLFAGALLGLACESAPVQEPAPLDEPAAPAAIESLPLDQLSAQRAWGDLEALSAVLVQRAGADPGDAARDYLVTQLEAAGVAVERLETPDGSEGADATTWTHVLATVPGASPDWFLLVAPLGELDATPADAGAVAEGASGAALLLELARVLSTRSLPYTTRMIWISGERRGAGTDDLGAAAATGDLRGSRALVAQMAARGELSRIRLLVAFDRVCREDLRVSRDLGSHRVHREEFFDAAARIGRSRTFPRQQGFESVEASHLAFRDAGVRDVTAIVGSSTQDATDAQAERPRCSEESLDAVGAVSLDALDTIGRRLAKIDRFSRAPLAGP